MYLDKKIITDSVSVDAEIEISDSLTSTNDYLKSQKPTRKIQVCLAEEQTAGRGRFDRAWQSPAGQNIYLSLRYPFQKPINELVGLSLVVSLAIVSACQLLKLPQAISVKWPNDVVCAGKKLAGSLIEIQAQADMASVIIGIGINVNMQHDNENKIDQPWTSLSNILGDVIDRNFLIANLLNTLFSYMQRFEAHGLKNFIDEWRLVDGLFDKIITLSLIDGEISGVAKGINELGQLVLVSEDGVARAYSSGEVSIKK